MKSKHEEHKEDSFHGCDKSVKPAYLDKDDDKCIRQQLPSHFYKHVNSIFGIRALFEE